MFNIIESLASVLNAPKALSSLDYKASKQVYLYPSSSMCYTTSGKPLGACIKQVWLYQKKYPTSNPDSAYNQMAAESGKIWENWLADQYKKMGIFLEQSTKLVDNELSTSCELDLLHINPETGEKEVTEVKTYSSSNWYGTKELLGYGTTKPKPKDAHLLQVVKYLMILKRYEIHKVNMVYIDRACGNFFNNKQFCVYLQGKDIYYETYYQNELLTIKETRFNTDSLKEKDEAVLKLIELDYVPEPDYLISYTLSDVEEKYREGYLTKKKYEAVKKGLVLPEELADFQCTYCKFYKNKQTGQSTCIDTVQID